MKCLRVKNGFGLLLAVIMTLHMLLPFFATYTDKAPPSGLASIFGEKVLMCTSEGFVWVKLEDLLAGKAPVKPHTSYFCPLCFIANDVAGKLLLLMAGFYLVYPMLSGRSIRLQISQKLRTHAHVVWHSRAPPLAFSY